MSDEEWETEADHIAEPDSKGNRGIDVANPFTENDTHAALEAAQGKFGPLDAQAKAAEEIRAEQERQITAKKAAVDAESDGLAAELNTLAAEFEQRKSQVETDFEQRRSSLGAEDEEEPIPPLMQLCQIFRDELGIDPGLNTKDCVTAAAADLSVQAQPGVPTADVARRCWLALGSPPPASRRESAAPTPLSPPPPPDSCVLKLDTTLTNGPSSERSGSMGQQEASAEADDGTVSLQEVMGSGAEINEAHQEAVVMGTAPPPTEMSMRDGLAANEAMINDAEINDVQQEVEAAEAEAEMQQAAAGGGEEATRPQMGTFKRPRQCGTPGCERVDHHSGPCTGQQPVGPRRRKKQQPLPGWRAVRYAAPTGRDERHFKHIQTGWYARGATEMRRKEEELRNLVAGWGPWFGGPSSPTSTGQRTRAPQESGGGGSTRDLASEEHAAAATPQAADPGTDLDDNDCDSSNDWEPASASASTCTKATCPACSQRTRRRRSEPLSPASEGTEPECGEVTLDEGAKGLVIWLYYPKHVQHHRAVVDGVHKELQGERLGSVTKVHVRFEAEPGDESRLVEPLPLASLKHVSPQIAAARERNPAGWHDNSSLTWCSSPPTRVTAPPGERGGGDAVMLALPSPPRTPQGASAPAQTQCAPRPLRCLEICACTGRLSMALRAHGGWEAVVHDRSNKFLEQPLAPFQPCRSAAELAAPSSAQLTKWLSCELTEIEPEELPLFDYIHASLCCATYSPMSQEKHQRNEDNNYLGTSLEAGSANEDLAHLVAILRSQLRRNPAFLFSLENPGGAGGRMQHVPMVKEDIEGDLGAVRCDVTYCMFERGVKKPTHLWTNSKARTAPLPAVTPHLCQPSPTRTLTFAHAPPSPQAVARLLQGFACSAATPCADAACGGHPKSVRGQGDYAEKAAFPRAFAATVARGINMDAAPQRRVPLRSQDTL